MTSTTPAGLLDDLHKVGVHVADVRDLVKAAYRYDAAIPVLLEWLQHVNERVAEAESHPLREALVRALTVPWAGPHVAAYMIELFRTVEDQSNLAIRWIVGNAIGVMVATLDFRDLERLVLDRRYGKARQMVVLGLGTSTDARAAPLLLELVKDDDVVAHAVDAIGRLKPLGARAVLEPLLQHPRPLVRREAKRALAKLV